MVLLPLMRRCLCHHCNCNCHPHDNGDVVVINAQVSLPSSSWRCYPCNNGVIVLDPWRRCYPCCDKVLAVLKLELFPLLQWHCHHHWGHHPCCLSSSLNCSCHCAGSFAIVAMAIVALVTMALLSLSMHRCLCCCQASVVALVAHCQAGIVAPVTIGLLPLMRRHLCHCHDCKCCPHDDGVVAVINAKTF